MVNLIDVVLEGVKKTVKWAIGLFKDGLRSGYQTLTESMFRTPIPQSDGTFTFGEPTNVPWPTIRDGLVGGEVMLIALFLLVMSVQGRHTIRIFNVGSGYEARKTKKTAWVGAFLIITWYWVGTLALYLINGFTIALLPDFSSVSTAMVRMLAVSITNPALALLFALSGGISMWALEALFYIRRILLYVYLYGMPIAFALAYGNLPVISDIAIGFAKRFVPLAISPLPAAMVIKGYELIYAAGSLTPSTVFLKYLVAASLPLVALYVTWKTFKYATPMTTKVIGGATKGAALIGGVSVGAYIGGAGVARTAALGGLRGAASHAVGQKAAQRGESRDGENSLPAYRRTENDSGSH